MWQNKKIHLSQANSKHIISPCSVSIRGGDACVLTELALYKVLLAVTRCTVAFKGTGNWLNFKLSGAHCGFLMPGVSVNLVLLLDQEDILVKNWPGVHPVPSIYFFFLCLKKHTYIILEDRRKRTQIYLLAAKMNRVNFISHLLFVGSSDNLPLVKFDWWPFLMLHVISPAGWPKRDFSGFLSLCIGLHFVDNLRFPNTFEGKEATRTKQMWILA